MKCFIRKEEGNYSYTAWYNDGKKDCYLGDISFDPELQVCNVLFYCWNIAIPIAIVVEICSQISALERQRIEGMT